MIGENNCRNWNFPFGKNCIFHIVKLDFDYNLPQSMTFNCAHLDQNLFAGSTEVVSLNIILDTSVMEHSQQTDWATMNPIFKINSFQKPLEEAYDSNAVLKTFHTARTTSMPNFMQVKAAVRKYLRVHTFRGFIYIDQPFSPALPEFFR